MNHPTFHDIEAAARRISSVAVPTPLMESAALNTQVGGRLLIKAEMLQRTGSFKFRGAYNTVNQLAAAGAPGIVAYSSGNHAQGVAAAAKLMGLPAVIVMPSDAPRTKIDNTRRLGGEVIEYDRFGESREEIGTKVSKERGFELVRPYDDPRVMAGQGTVGLEMAHQAAAKDARLDAVLCPCGGGGLIGGTALVFDTLSPDTAIHPVEPVGFDDWARSLAAGERLSNPPGATSFCDSLLTPEPGVLTFDVNAPLLKAGLTVTDAQVADAMALAFKELKVVIEPGGAVALAACLSGAYSCQDRTVGIICSGGNVDADVFADALLGRI